MFELTTPMAVGDTEKLELVTHVHESWAERRVGAFVFTNLPDPDPSNKCAFVAVTLPTATEEAAAEA